MNSMQDEKFYCKELKNICIILFSIKCGLDVSNISYFNKTKILDQLKYILIRSKLTDTYAKVFTIKKEFNDNTISMI